MLSKLVAFLGQRKALAGIVLAVGMLLASCASPTAADQAASVNGTKISMDQYLRLSRLIYNLNNAQAANPTWQTPKGRATLATYQQQALQYLISDMLLVKEAKTLESQHKLGTTVTALNQTVDQSVTSELKAVPPSYQFLVSQGVLVPDIFRFVIVQNQFANAVLRQVSVPIAHVRILTVAKKSDAEALQKQLQQGTDWVSLALKQSTDKAKAQGGDIAQLPPSVLPTQLDHAIFATRVTPDAIQLVQSPLGYSLVRVLSITDTQIINLDSTVPVIPGSATIQTAAIFDFIDSLFNQAKISIDVNWCGAANGVCSTINPQPQPVSQ